MKNKFKTNIKEREQVKMFIAYLKKMNKKGRIKLSNVNRKVDINSDLEGQVNIKDAIKGSFVDVALYEYSKTTQKN